MLAAAHGAAVSGPWPDFDGHWLGLLRESVGPGVPIVCTLDLHANVSPAMVAACDATLAYRTNPHLDQHETGTRAAALLARTLRREVRPVQALVQVPVAPAIDRQATDEAPMAGWMAEAEAVRRRPGVLDVSVLPGFAYADVPEMGASCIVVTDADRGLAERAAGGLSGWMVEQRERFACSLATVGEAVEEAAASSERTLLLDVGDNVGGGSPGDATWLAAALVERRMSPGQWCA